MSTRSLSTTGATFSGLAVKMGRIRARFSRQALMSRVTRRFKLYRRHLTQLKLSATRESFFSSQARIKSQPQTTPAQMIPIEKATIAMLSTTRACQEEVRPATRSSRSPPTTVTTRPTPSSHLSSLLAPCMVSSTWLTPQMVSFQLRYCHMMSSHCLRRCLCLIAEKLVEMCGVERTRGDSWCLLLWLSSHWVR